MASKRQRRPRVWVEPVAPGVVRYFETGETPDDFETFLLIVARHQTTLQGLWQAHRDAVLTTWRQEHPGTRPWLWWRLDAPEPARRRLGGTGQCRVEVLPGMGASLDDGIDLGFWDRADQEFYDGFDPTVQGVVFDVNDPPVFESQAAYLKRHGLLTSNEAARLGPADFEPEVIGGNTP